MNVIASMYDPVGYEKELAPLRGLGYEIEYVSLAPDADVLERLCGYPYLIAAGELYTAEALEVLAAHGLKGMTRLGVGYDRIDVQAARRLGVDVCNTPGANADAVAEHALMLTLAAARGVGLNNREMHDGLWNRTAPRDLAGCTVGLVGFGRIARVYARLIRPLAGRILAYDPFPDAEAARALGVELTPLDDVLAEADVLSLHLPLTEETAGMADRVFFSKLRPGAIFINTSRGPIVDEAALCDALKDGRLFAAGLDVFCEEPPAADHPLRGLENCIMTPHNASLSEAAFHSMLAMASDNLTALITGEGRAYRVN